MYIVTRPQRLAKHCIALFYKKKVYKDKKC